MLFCKHVKCDNCYARSVCVNVPPYTKQAMEALHEKIAEIERLADAMGVGLQIVMKSLSGNS